MIGLFYFTVKLNRGAMIDEEPSFRSLSRDERRDRIVWAAKRVFLDKGLDTASMDDVAAAAGATKPTVYAHFKSKDELFAAVVDLIKGLFLGKLRSPDAYAADPVEAVALFCGRFLELMCWRDAVGYQRVVLAAAARSPANAKAVYVTLHAEACRILATYLRTRKLTRRPEQHAELLLSAATGGAVLRHLFGVEEPCPDMPDEENIGEHVDLKPIREAIKTLAKSWK
jgi:AcrR family transcriptional regulator